MAVYHLKSSTSIFAPKTSIAVDTNILLWTFYDNITYTKNYQKNIYPVFLGNILQDKKNKIYTTIYNIFEMYNIIEDTEYKIYTKLNNLSEIDFRKKDYRKIDDERIKIKNKLELIQKQISSSICIIDYKTDIDFLNDYTLNFIKHKYDIFDFSLIKCCIENNISSILTDDSDFSTNSYLINKLNIITANVNLN